MHTSSIHTPACRIPSLSVCRLFHSLNTVQNIFLNYTAQLRCHNTSAELLDTAARLPSRTSRTVALPPALHSLVASAASPPSSLGDISKPWNYMACSALILEPLTSNGDGFFVEVFSSNVATCVQGEDLCRGGCPDCLPAVCVVDRRTDPLCGARLRTPVPRCFGVSTPQRHLL